MHVSFYSFSTSVPYLTIKLQNKWDFKLRKGGGATFGNFYRELNMFEFPSGGGAHPESGPFPTLDPRMLLL